MQEEMSQSNNVIEMPNMNNLGSVSAATGVSGTTSISNIEYASTSWELDDGDNIPEFSLDTSATIPGKFSTTISNILSKHCNEVKVIAEDSLQTLVSVSKRKLRELLTKQNNEIFAFMERADRTPQMLGLAETIFRRYGHDISTIRGGNTSKSLLKELNLDVSMCEVTAEFETGLNSIKGSTTLDTFTKQLRWMLNQYKTIGEEAIRLETVMYQKIDMLDKVNSRIPAITSLKTNEMLPSLIDMFGKYAESVYKSSQIEEDYKALIAAYKKWNICRQIVSLQTALRVDVNEPQCAICLTEAVSTAIVPCGHTFCGSCAKKQNTTCYICRGTIRERLKLYFT